MVIPKRVLSEARQALKKYLKANYEDEPLNHPMGPPDIKWNPEHFKINRECVNKFWEIMLNEHVVAKHPYGGYMHPRFQFSDHPSVAEVKQNVLAELKHVTDPNDEMGEPTPKVVYDFAIGDKNLRDQAVELFHQWLHKHGTGFSDEFVDPSSGQRILISSDRPLWVRFMSEIDNPVPDLAYRASLRSQLIGEDLP